MSRYVTVHDGRFHADDVTACALLRILYPEIKIIRTRNPKEFTGIVVDVGEGALDHHGKASGGLDPRGHKWCGCTKLWIRGKLGKKFFRDPELSREFYFQVLVPVADDDNGNHYSSYCTFIKDFNVDFDDEYGDNNTAFESAVNWAKAWLQNQIRKTHANARAASLREFLPLNERIVVMPQFIPGWQKHLGTFSEVAEFGVFPDNGTWRTQPIRDWVGRYRNAFPNTWCIQEKEFWPEGLEFCASDGFLAGFRTLENALSALKELL